MPFRGSRRLPIRVAYVVVGIGSAIWLLVDAVHGRLDSLGFIGVVAAILSLAGDGGSRRWERDQPGPSLADRAQRLADILAVEWPGKVAARQLREPGILPLTWIEVSAADPAVPVRPDGPTGRLHRDFDEMANRLARLYLDGSKRLVVLGQPGAGKSVAALTLQVGLLEIRRANPDLPVPVLLPVASWDPVIQTLEDFVVARLARDYYSGREEDPRLLLRAGMLLPILDGLDEIPEYGRGPAVLDINDGIARYDRPIVLTCRLVEYDDLIRAGSPGLREATVVKVLPVRPRDAVDYLRQVRWPDQAAWDDVFAEFERAGSPVAEAYSTPLMVSVARTVYGELGHDPAEQLDHERYDSRLAVENGLIDRLVDAAWVPPGSRWTAAQARRYLTVLARRLYRDGDRDLVLWELPGRMVPQWTVLFIGLFVGLLALIGTTLWTVVAVGSDAVTSGLAVGTAVGAGFVPLVFVAWVTSTDAVGRLPIGRAVSGVGRRYVDSGMGTIAALWLATAGIGVVIVSVAGGWTVRNTERSLLLGGISLGAGLAVFAALSVNSWSFGAASQAELISPKEVLRHDRLSSLVGALGAGLVFALVLTPLLIIGGWSTSMAVGWVTGGSGWAEPGDPRGLFAARWFDIGPGFFGTPALAIGGLVVLPGVMIGVATLFTRAWFRFAITRIILAARGELPWRLFDFLDEARDRGLLRESAGAYQFRHVRLLERLADGHAPTVPAGRDSARVERRRRRQLVVISVGVLAVIGSIPLLAVPHDRADTVLRLPYQVVTSEVLVSPDGRTLATVSDDGARLWRLPSGRAPLTFIPDRGDQWRVVFNTSGALALVRSTGQAEVWRTDGSRDRPLASAQPTGDLVLLPGGNRFGVVSRTDDSAGTVLTVRSETGEPLGSPIRGRLASAVRDDGDGERRTDPRAERYLLAGNEDRSLAVWDLSGDPRQVATLPDTSSDPDDAEIAPGATRVLVRVPGGARLFDLPSGRPIAPLRFRVSDSQVEFSPDGRWVAAAYRGQDSDEGATAVTVWDAATGVAQGTMTGPADIDFLSFGQAGRTVLIGAGTTVQVWPIGADRPARVLTGVDGYQLYRRPSGSILLVVRQPEATASAADPLGQAEIVDADSGGTIRTVRAPGRITEPSSSSTKLVDLDATEAAPMMLGEDAEERTLAWDGWTGHPLGVDARVDWYSTVPAPNGRVFLGLGPDRMAVYQAATGALIGRVEEDVDPFLSYGSTDGIQFSPDGRFVATLVPQADAVRVWDTGDAHLVATLRGHSGAVKSLRWGEGDTTGHTVITVGEQDSTVRLWHIAEGR